MRPTISSLLSGKVSRAAMLAAVAALGGCSSDVGRFSNADPIYTGSTPNQRRIMGDNGYGNAYASPQQGMGQMPERQWRNVDTTGSIDQGSAAVSRADLTPPASGAYAETVARPIAEAPRASDPTAGYTQVAAANGGWSQHGGTYVTLRQGETLDTLSNRYGVPMTALRQANAYQPGRTAMPGERVLIPVYQAPSAAAPAPAVPARPAPVATAPMRPAPAAAPVPTAVRPAPQASLAPRPMAPPPGQMVTGSVPTAPKPVATQTIAVTPKPVAAAPQPPQGGVKLVGAYTAKSGDTLASIARTYGVTEQALRERNGLKTSAIQPGQQILLPAGTKLMLKTSQAPAPAAAPTAKPTAVAAAPAAAPAAQPQKPVQVAAAKPTAPAPAAKDTSKADQKAAETIAVAREADDDKSGANGSFRWPVRGRIISEYGTKANGEKNEGINLAVPEGTSVKAADGGEVIYSGNELKGYGNLVLVRHDNGYVTAYAHASELLVNRGDKVSRGQIIARAGATGSVSQPQLHFELRKGQKAVDPKPYLASN